MEDEPEQETLFYIEGPDERGCVWIHGANSIASLRCYRSGSVLSTTMKTNERLRNAEAGAPSMIAIAAVVAAFAGPAVLHIHTTAHGEQFAYFSSFERCEAFRRELEADWERRTREQFGIDAPRPLPKAVLGTESTARCIPG